MADSRAFYINQGISAMDLAYAIRGFFQIDKGLVSEVVDTPQGIIIQARQTDGWKKFAGMDNSIQVQLIDQGTTVIVNVGSGQWIDKAGAAAIGMFIFAPLAITAIIGARNTKRLPEEIFGFIDYFIVTGGKTAAVPPQPASYASRNVTSKCVRCNADIPEGSKFCFMCGATVPEKTAGVVVCARCGRSLPDTMRFCPECGEATFK